jgi:cytochrome c2
MKGKIGSVLLAMLALGACSKAPDGDAAGKAPAAPSGARLFAQCAVCHTAAPPDTPAGKQRLVGPPLWGVVGRPAGSIEGFNYSRAMKNSGLVWDEATLDRYLANPQEVLPGTLMSYAGEPDPAKRAALIEHLKTLN